VIHNIGSRTDKYSISAVQPIIKIKLDCLLLIVNNKIKIMETLEIEKIKENSASVLAQATICGIQ